MSYERIKKGLGITLALPILVPLLAIVGVLRIINEIITRTFGRAIVVCPHCGVPGVVESKNPQVVR
jgi:hypothetical protein